MCVCVCVLTRLDDPADGVCSDDSNCTLSPDPALSLVRSHSFRLFQAQTEYTAR